MVPPDKDAPMEAATLDQPVGMDGTNAVHSWWQELQDDAFAALFGVHGLGEGWAFFWYFPSLSSHRLCAMPHVTIVFVNFAHDCARRGGGAGGGEDEAEGEGEGDMDSEWG